ncbi:MAG: hypothetical protein ABWY78_06165 [Microvirga sp.]
MRPALAPSLGRIVWYRAEAEEVRPAIITAVQGNQQVNLQVFCDGDDAVLLGGNTTVPRLSVQQGPDVGEWEWPPAMVEEV